MAVLHNGSEVTAIKYGLADIAKVMYGTDLVWKVGGVVVSGFEGWVKHDADHSSRKTYTTTDGRFAISWGDGIQDNVLAGHSTNVGMDIPELAGKDYNLRVSMYYSNKSGNYYATVFAQGLKEEGRHDYGMDAIGCRFQYNSSYGTGFSIRKRLVSNITSNYTPKTTVIGPVPFVKLGSLGLYVILTLQRRGTSIHYKVERTESGEVLWEGVEESVPFNDSGGSLFFNTDENGTKFYNFELEIL